MDAQQFMRAFGHVAKAPGGISKLRELILSLAVSGRLVPHVRDEPPASAWLDECDRRKAGLSGRRADHAVADITPESYPFDPPPGWTFARLGRFTSKIGSGSTPRGGSQAYVHTGVPFLRSQNVWNDGLRLDDVAYISEETNASMSGTQVLAHDLLLNITGASLGRCALAPEHLGSANVSQHVTIIRLVDSTARHYLHLCLQSPLLQQMIWGRQVGMAREGLSKKVLEQFEIPIPPIVEQLRIVERVRDLMALCDTLERQQQARRQLQTSLRQASLQALVDSSSPHDIQANSAALVTALKHLVERAEDVDELIGEVKTLAVLGMLAPASTKPAPLAEIRADTYTLRDNYVAQGSLRRQKSVAIAGPTHTYPDHWGVMPFDEAAVVMGGVTKGRDLRGQKVVSCPYLAVANVQRGHFKLIGLKSIEVAEGELEKYSVKVGDLLMTEGGDWDKVGRTAIWRGEVARCLHQNHVFKARVPSGHLLNEWVELVFNSGVGRAYFAGAAKQTTNLASINMTQLRSFPLPVPPLDEQKDILKRLAALTQVADDWRQLLQKKAELATQLATATIAAFTGATLTPTEAPMKAPPTELIAPLRLGRAPDVQAQAPLATLLAQHQGTLSAKALWQRFGGEIDAFYAQLKTEVDHGWIEKPEPATVQLSPQA